ncbi:MAG: hypothetical protein ACT4OV_15910, partial [Microthrixaceae bacterium]
MRLLQLATAPDETLDLHPNVTIVTGLDDARRSMLIDTVRGLARSDVRPGGGLLEAHGVLFDFDPALFEVIEAAPEYLDPVVHLDHLPNQLGAVDADELRAREEAFAALVDQVAAQADLQHAARDAVSAAGRAL